MEGEHLPDSNFSRILLLYILPFSYGAATRVPFVFASLHCVLVLGASLPTLAGVLGCYQVGNRDTVSHPQAITLSATHIVGAGSVSCRPEADGVLAGCPAHQSLLHTSASSGRQHLVLL